MRHAAMVLLLGVAGCGTLPIEGDGIVLLQLVQPSSLTLREGSSVQLRARALDKTGAEVAAEIVWRTPDEGVRVGETTGLITGQAANGTARVQASVGSLRSDFITFTLRPAE